MIPCKNCEKKPHESNHPTGMIFVGYGLGWQHCGTCRGTGQVREPTPWGWSNVEHPESWNGTACSREDAIAEGRQEYGKEGFWIASGQWLQFKELIDADDVVEMMRDRLSDIGPDDAELDVKTDAMPALNKILYEWAEEYIGAPEYWSQIGSSEYISGAES